MSSSYGTKRYCCVTGCHNSGHTLKTWAETECEIHLRQHRFCICQEPFQLLTFPKSDSALRQGWIRCVNRGVKGKTGLWEPNADSRICSEHFTKGHPYPTVNLGHNNIPSEYQVPQRPPPSKRRHVPTTDTSPPDTPTVSSDVQEETAPQSSHSTCKGLKADILSDHGYAVIDWEDSDCTRCHRLQARICELKEEVRQLKLAIQTQSVAKISEKDAIFKKKGVMSIWTGTDRKTFDGIFKCIAQDVRKMNYWKGPKRTGNRSNEKCTPGPKRRLSKKNELFIALLKLKTGLNMSIIGDLFGISPSSVSRICLTWWRYLSKSIGSLVYNPEKNVVMATRPAAFKDHAYRDVRHIIDGTEIFIETPKNLALAASCYSDYKHHYTVKYLVSINPNGHINFVSKGWGGRVSDNHITKHCGFLDMLQQSDKVVPPGRKGEAQMTQEDVQKTGSVANRRIYVEQAIRRIKCFKFLQNEVPITLVHSLDDAMRLACGLCNLRCPLAK